MVFPSVDNISIVHSDVVGRWHKHADANSSIYRCGHDEQLTAHSNWRVWKIVFLLGTGVNFSHFEGSVFQHQFRVSYFHECPHTFHRNPGWQNCLLKSIS